MMMTRYVLAVLFVGFLACEPALAESPIAAFPQNTGVIVRLKNPQETLQKTGDLAVKVDRNEGAKVQLATPMLGMMISNPMLQGVDLKGEWWLAVFPVADGDPGVVFCIPATDADAMEKAVTGDYQFQTYKKWVIYTEHKETAETIQNQISKNGNSIASLFDKTSTAIWEEGDLSLFINVPHLLTIYRGAFDQGVKEANDFFDQMPTMLPPQAGVDMKAVAELYAGAFRALVQGVKDAQGCTAALSVTEEGVSLNEYAGFKDGSMTSRALAKYEPARLGQLDQLPARRLAYGAAELDMDALIQWGLKFSLEPFAKGDTEKQKQVKKLLGEYQKLDFGGMAMCFGLGNPKNGAMRMSALVDVKQPKDVRELARKSTELMGDYTVGGMTMKTTYNAEAETYGDLKADVTRVKYEFDENVDPFQAQMQGKMNEMLYGPDGMVTRTFYLKDKLAQSVGGTKADAQALLDALDGKNTIGDVPAFQSTRKALLPKANLIGLWDLPGTIAAGLDLATRAGGPVPFNEMDINNIRGETSFLGFSLSREENGLRAKTVVPLKQMQGVARFVQLIREMEQQGL